MLTINKAFSTCNINKKLDTIKIIVIGYSIPCKEYNFVYVILCHISYCIYKAYMLSERRTKMVNVCNILKNELHIMQQVKAYNNRKFTQALDSVGRCKEHQSISNLLTVYLYIYMFCKRPVAFIVKMISIEF